MKTTSERGIKFIESNEGFRDKPYLDVAGVRTWGYGTAHDVPEEGEITPEEAEAILKSDVAYIEAWINRVVTVPINQNQFDAIVDFCYNVGVSAFRYSTLLRLLNQGLYDEAASQFLRWDKARVDGKLIPVAGLAKRRQRERLLFLDNSDQPNV